MRDKNIEKIQNLLNNQKIIKTKLISSSFGINCLKIKIVVIKALYLNYIKIKKTNSIRLKQKQKT